MARRASILVVDDDAAIRRTLSKILEKEGYLVETMESGRKAIEASNENCLPLSKPTPTKTRYSS